MVSLWSASITHGAVGQSPVLTIERRLRGTFAVLPSGTVERLSVFKLSKEVEETVRVGTAARARAVQGPR